MTAVWGKGFLRQRKWTNLIHSHFWDLTKLPCAISFANATVSEKGEHYVKMTGVCKDSVCASVFIGTIESAPRRDSRVVGNCSLTGKFTTHHHERRARHLTGDRRAAACQKMTREGFSASMVERLEANNDMLFGGNRPAHLPNSNVLRVAKHGELRKNQLHDDPIIAMCIAKTMNKYKNAIQNVGYDRFFVHYWSSLQLHV